MNEKILKTKSNGFAALFFIVLMIIVAIASFISSIAFLKNEALLGITQERLKILDSIL